MEVRPKKFLGQHFLIDEDIASRIVESLVYHQNCKNVLEIGPGMGVLTKYLFAKQEINTSVIEIDRESYAYLCAKYPEKVDKIISADFLHSDLNLLFADNFVVIGNFPYNISTQILFKVLDYRNQIPEVVGMFQKEVAERVAGKPKNKAYGIITVLIQAFYNVEYLFTVDETVFNPPPKVKSAVIRLTRNDRQNLNCNEGLFIQVVKQGFNQRRKTLRNSLRSLFPNLDTENKVLGQRAEELSVDEFVALTNWLEDSCK